ncbi:alpha-L-rhamnosidase C-terminal domain-containing protein [Cerasicoccus maritimus]|uniref:alpha-L-rhamnosidase-related protein n=1 Tax=Cerasicoccus maritimus TaxID=490089 RepID=UPI0028526C8D|nr:alpha-L-rhamnosidase C-terminal domain-containing protein [Cerasicoccus maritimus]
MRVTRLVPDHPRHPAWANMSADHPAEQAAWVWITDDLTSPWALVSFQLEFTLDQPESLRFHVTADQRFQLKLNEQHVALGPDRSDIHHWAVACYQADLEAGNHCFEALVWWLNPKLSPMAQESHRPAFLLAGEGNWSTKLSTGLASWRAYNLSPALHCQPPKVPGYHVVGPEFHFDLNQWSLKHSLPTQIIRAPLQAERYGTRAPGWRLQPNTLPEQDFKLIRGGRLVAIRNEISDCPFSTSNTNTKQATDEWNDLLNNQASLEIPKASNYEAIIDLGNYRCGYPDIAIQGGADAQIELHWAESLFEESHASHINEHSPKGNRSNISGKSFVGIGDRWILDGHEWRLPTLWWRSGRYLRLRIKTKDTPVRICHLAIRRTGIPYQRDSQFDCDNEAFLNVWPTLEAGLLNCAHEQWVDCPYYEQLSYVGDSISELSFYCLTKDASLSRRCLELFDWSRQDGGWVAERYPSKHRQDSFTYALLYPRLLREHAYWRDDANFIQERLPGLRSLISECLHWRQPNGLLGRVPGWSFIDWVDTWDEGCGPGVRDGDSSLVNLHLVFALRFYADIENAFGERSLARHAQKLAHELGRQTKAKYWRTSLSLLADDTLSEHFSEHAQALAILSGILTTTEKKSCLQSWLERKDQLAAMSIYFSYYGLDALYHMGASDTFYERLTFWEQLPSLGFCTTPERPEPSRSDCHGWGAHPIHHAFASMAGIRPGAVGFKHIHIAPMPGKLNRIKLTMPHPRGEICFDWSRQGHEEIYNIQIPDEVTATWERNGRQVNFAQRLSNH